MKIYCIRDFKNAVEKLKKKNSYNEIEQETINCFFGKNIEELKRGTKLNGSSPHYFVKKRLKGRGGFRMYYYIFIEDDDVHLLFVHPKSGSMGGENITDAKKEELTETLLKQKQEKDYFLVEQESKKIKFTHISEIH